MTDTSSSSPGTASDVDTLRAAYEAAVDEWQEVQSRRAYPQWHFMTNVVVPAQKYIAALLAENERQAAALAEERDQHETTRIDLQVFREFVTEWLDGHHVPREVEHSGHRVILMPRARLRHFSEMLEASADADTAAGGEEEGT